MGHNGAIPFIKLQVDFFNQQNHGIQAVWRQGRLSSRLLTSRFLMSKTFNPKPFDSKTFDARFDHRSKVIYAKYSKQFNETHTFMCLGRAGRFGQLSLGERLFLPILWKFELADRS